MSSAASARNNNDGLQRLRLCHARNRAAPRRDSFRSARISLLANDSARFLAHLNKRKEKR